MRRIAHELDNFFKTISFKRPSTGEYRRYVRHRSDFDRLQGDLKDIDNGTKQIFQAAIGAMIASSRIYILCYGPWRAYIHRADDGSMCGLIFADCR